MSKRRRKDQLGQTYYNTQRPGAYGGVEPLKRATKQKRSVIKRWLSHQDAYTLHKPVRYKFPRRRTIVGGIDHQFQADLIDVSRLRKDNDNFTFLLTVIDVLSKYAWVQPLKNKTGPELVKALQHIFSQGRKPFKLQTDKGKEFTNKIVQQFLRDQRVGFFTTENEDIKAAIVERFNRTLKEKLWRYFTRHNTTRYVEALSRLVRAYNRSYHRSIQRAPADVNTTNQEDVWQTLYGHPLVLDRKPKLKAGDRVRISKARRVFKKGYLPLWTDELFSISRVLNTVPVTFVLKDDHGDELRGSFYAQEIQKVGDKVIYRLDSILKQRNSKSGGCEYLVRWKGYDPSFDSWVPESSLVNYT